MILEDLGVLIVRVEAKAYFFIRTSRKKYAFATTLIKMNAPLKNINVTVKNVGGRQSIIMWKKAHSYVEEQF